jgi:bifunctional UDP-N-acetylglucosamine pyrophosphorylase/glucosamine-1-phosphate N-acetyltransferase
MLEAVLRSAESLRPSQIVVVLGASRAAVEPLLAGRDVTVVVQDPPRGTGDAVVRALAALSGGDGPVLILSGDVPLIRRETLTGLLDKVGEGADLALLTFRPPEPGAFGRVVRDRRGRVQRIVESRNATARERSIGEVNAGIYAFQAPALARAAARLREDPVSREIYLTDAVEILTSARNRVETAESGDWREAWGINTRTDLAAAEEIARRRALEAALEAGVTLIDPATIRIGPDVQLEPDVVLHPFVSLEGRTVLRERCEILPFTRIVGSEVAPDVVIGPHCDIEGAVIGARSRVGPFARLRPETVLEEDVRVGNFVETKKTTLRRGVKALHLSYLGDAEIGAETNVGAGIITCNYDGEKKNRTTVGSGVFLGSDSQLIAPVTIGEGAYVGAGSTITQDVPPGALAISRVPQKNIEGWAEKRRKRSGREAEGARGRGNEGARGRGGEGEKE